jgi:hypothetical protein
MGTIFFIIPIIGIVLSLVAIVSPRTAWFLQDGWKYSNVEPSNAALVMIRIGGIVGVIGCIIFMNIASNF